ncbi:MAG: hypothetical protein IAX21_07965 [Candidatus Bathyarchaeota archaeon]|nr:hypothetical protein [Candidatus Bathyarchaeum tardum]WNZ28587.1 MAG: hypothetical protein IAX21_07965 [Candidatus Bathyarchaeota archaeon]
MGNKNIVQNQVVEELKKPETYQESPKKIEVKQTHISYVFLTEKFVYKVKKAVNFGFLDFSTLEKRRHFCEKELVLNKRLCRDMYLEVVSINRSSSGQIRINGEGETVEFAVKMKKMPDETIMTRLLEENKIDKNIMDKMAKIIADFHEKVDASRTNGEFEAISIIETNWKENFEQTQEFICRSISAKTHQFIQEKIDQFMKNNQYLLKKRVIENKIKKCHGDMHSGNIFVADKIYIFDAIEFNERFSNCDVASEIAFLAMDLDFKGHKDLSRFFVEKYVKYSGDQELLELLDFYKCYRAYVRGKVTSFKLNDPSVSEEEKTATIKEATAYFELALEYAKKM